MRTACSSTSTLHRYSEGLHYAYELRRNTENRGPEDGGNMVLRNVRYLSLSPHAVTTHNTNIGMLSY